MAFLKFEDKIIEIFILRLKNIYLLVKTNSHKCIGNEKKGVKGNFFVL